MKLTNTKRRNRSEIKDSPKFRPIRDRVKEKRGKGKGRGGGKPVI